MYKSKKVESQFEVINYQNKNTNFKNTNSKNTNTNSNSRLA